MTATRTCGASPSTRIALAWPQTSVFAAVMAISCAPNDDNATTPPPGAADGVVLDSRRQLQIRDWPMAGRPPPATVPVTALVATPAPAAVGAAPVSPRDSRHSREPEMRPWTGDTDKHH